MYIFISGLVVNFTDTIVPVVSRYSANKISKSFICIKVLYNSHNVRTFKSSNSMPSHCIPNTFVSKRAREQLQAYFVK